MHSIKREHFCVCGVWQTVICFVFSRFSLHVLELHLIFLAWLQKQACGCRCTGLAPEDADSEAMQHMLKHRTQCSSICSPQRCVKMLQRGSQFKYLI